MSDEQVSGEPEYPEHQKLRAVRDKSQAIGEFLEQLESESISLCTWNDRRERFERLDKSAQQILASYFEIDLMKIDDEKRDMIERMRK